MTPAEAKQTLRGSSKQLLSIAEVIVALEEEKQSALKTLWFVLSKHGGVIRISDMDRFTMPQNWELVTEYSFETRETTIRINPSIP